MTCVLLMPSFAHAMSIFTPNEGDISLNILSQLFGDLVDAASGENGKYAQAGLWLGTGLDPFQYVLRVFNYAALFVGGLLAAYAVLMAAVNTSHEGIAFGKELNNPFFILRFATGVIFILPIISGYCVLQVIVMWVIIHSVGMADTTWKAWFGVNDSEIGCSWGDRNICKDKNENGNIQDLYALKIPSPQVAEVAYKTFEGYTCVYGLASQHIKGELDNAGANRSVQNTNDLNVNFNQITATIDAERGTPGLAIANNADPNGGMIDGYTYHSGNSRTEAEVEQIREQQRLAESQKSQQQYINNYNNVRNRTINSLDSIVRNMNMNVEYNPALYTSNSANKTFRFGVGNIPAPSAGSASANSTACGFIDFGRTTGSNASQRLYDAAKSVEATNPNTAKVLRSNGQMESYKDLISAQNTRNAKNSRIIANDKEAVLKIYAEQYKGLHDEIRDLAKDYVSEVNTKIRFLEKSTSGNNAPDANEVSRMKAELLIKYNDKIHVAYTKFEQNLIKSIYNVYMSANNARYEANKRRNGSSIAGLSASNNDFGNYVDFIKVARDNAMTDGWATSGMWYMSMTQSISKLHELTSIKPFIGWASNNVKEYNAFVSNNNGLASMTNNMVADMIDYYGLFTQHAAYSTNKAIIQASQNEGVDTTNAIAALGMNIDVTNLFDSSRHPVILLTETGHNLIGAAESFMQMNSYWSARNTPMIFNKDKQMMPDPNNPASQAGVMLSYFAGAILVMGFMMAYYLPALPFLIWVGAMLGWLISVVEAVFIAPLWGVMHLHPEGSKYTGKGQAGYGLLMSLALRPTLMILGLIASLIIVQVFGMFVNYIFAIGMNVSLQPNEGASGDITVSKLMYVLSLYGIYLIFMMGLITKMFNIITIIPDQILKWIGGSNGNLSEYGAIGGEQTAGKLNNLASTASNAYAHRLKEKGQFEGQNDARALGTYNAAGGNYQAARSMGLSANYSESDMKKMSNGEVGGGLARIHNDLNASDSQPIASSAGSSIPASARTIGDRQRFVESRNGLYNMAIDAGMNEQQAQQYANDMASIGYNDQQFNAAVNNWASRGVMTRANPEIAQQALLNAQESARVAHENGESGSNAYLKNITSNYVQNVSNSKATIQAQQYGVGYSAANTNVSAQDEFVISGANATPMQSNPNVETVNASQSPYVSQPVVEQTQLVQTSGNNTVAMSATDSPSLDRRSNIGYDSNKSV